MSLGGGPSYSNRDANTNFGPDFLKRINFHALLSRILSMMKLSRLAACALIFTATLTNVAYARDLDKSDPDRAHILAATDQDSGPLGAMLGSRIQKWKRGYGD
ncbi:hypothetical protein WJ99_03820 [Burkholderia ubonensis]|nr:hypothetical protein WI86_15700 [Burkholderia ubonensis]KVQ16528.1 hypothetical protein WJ99_03820 [Burkholderia ubonensis]OJB36005.1 hypothetical protein BGV56_14250 [Burkholderia ubonensis]